MVSIFSGSSVIAEYDNGAAPSSPSREYIYNPAGGATTGLLAMISGYKRDSESGLDYALARYYDSRTGTFCSADPRAGSPGDPQSWNRYPYARNDPIDKVDPSGKFFFLIPLVEALVGAMEATLPEVVTTITVTATAAPWIDTLARIIREV